MAFSVDAAVEVLKTIDKSYQGHSGIFAFQRDGQLYLVGKKAVAVVDAGVPCCYMNMINHDDTLDSYIDNPFRGKSETVNEHGRIVKSEAGRFELLCRDSDGENDSLENILNIGNKTNEKFPDDGRIRMISHGERYHSHKHGYSVDGVDVSVTDARVMIRKEYFDLIRMQELRAREEMGGVNHEGYAVSPLPGISIITNHALVSFPLPTKLRFDGFGTRFERHYADKSPVINKDMINFSRNLSPSDVSPYTFNVVLLPGELKSFSHEDFSKNYGNTLGVLERLKDCYTSAVQSVVAGANLLHNLKYTEKIAEWKSFHDKKQKQIA